MDRCIGTGYRLCVNGAGLWLCALLWASASWAEVDSIGAESKFPYPDPILANSVFFGVSVAVSGETAVVGAMNAQAESTSPGAAYVYARDGAGWVQQAKLIDADSATHSYFGHSVAIAGDTLIIGAPGGPTTFGPGAVYVFVRSDGIWSLQQRILADDGQSTEQFGYAVAISGDTVLIGTPGDTPGTPYGQGSVYVYTRTAGLWSLQTKLTEEVPVIANFFGSSVALHDDTALIGVSASESYRGAAYVFTRDNGVWAEQARLTAIDGVAGDQFGQAVAIHGDTAVVGAFLDQVDGVQQKGSAHVFVRNAGIWSLQQQLVLDDGGIAPQFGLGVALEDDTLLVGARRESVNVNYQGAVAHFQRQNGQWNRQQMLLASDAAANDAFGHSVAISGSNVIVGAYLAEPIGAPANTDAGAVYFYRQQPALPVDIFSHGFE